MIITVCMAAGFQEAVQNKIFGFWGHIRIQEKQPSLSVLEKMNPIQKNDSLLQQLNHHPDISSVHPFATQYALLKTRNEMEGILLKGIDDKVGWSKYAAFLKTGSVPKIESNDFSRGILVSQQQAKRLQLQVNDSLVLYFTQQEGPPRAKKVFIAGIFQTGIEEYDRLFALADLRLIRQVNGWTENQVGGYEIFVRDPSNLDKIANELYQAENFPTTWDVIPIKNVAPQLFDWLNMQVVTRNVLIVIMTIVALINLITSLLVLVLERIQMIGILKALGAADKTIQQLFLRYALLLTTAGILVGTLLAFMLMGLQQKTGFIHLDESAYYIDKIEFKIMPVQIALIMAGTLVVSLLVLLLPTLLVKRISPVRAIRFS
jgi:lipoprotein-releasing system permease protein